MINWHRVRDLRKDVGADEFGEIVEIFLSEVEDIASALRAAGNDRDMELHLHALKNAAVNLGFFELSELCQIAEVFASRKQAASVDIRRILWALEASLRLFKKEAPGQLAN